MTQTEQLYQQTLQHLEQAKTTMKKLMSISDDWTANKMLETDFDELEDSIREFGRCNLLLPNS